MTLKRWSYVTHAYENYEVPKEWKLSLYETDMEVLINCCQCGKEIEFGESYTSFEIHTEVGFGFMVCPKCHECELERKDNSIDIGEIHINDFVRTKDGEIHRVIEVMAGYEVDSIYYGFENCMGDFRENIYRYSPILMDLIEEGDFVNGMKVELFDDEEENMYLGFPIYNDCLMDCIEEVLPLEEVKITSVLTHEQFEKMAFVVEGDNLKEGEKE